MTDEQKQALERVMASIKDKPPPSIRVNPETGKLSQLVPIAENVAGDVLAVLSLVKEHDKVTDALLIGCEAVAAEHDAAMLVIHHANDLKHLLDKVGGA